MINLKIDISSFQQLNESENQILKYIYSKGSEICKMSVQQFAREVSCAPSSVIRFCKKIGLILVPVICFGKPCSLLISDDLCIVSGRHGIKSL